MRRIPHRRLLRASVFQYLLIELNKSNIVYFYLIVFGYGFLAVFIISVLSVIALFLFPIMNKAFFQYIMALFTALAVGTLVGDVLFHLIPFVSIQSKRETAEFRLEVTLKILQVALYNSKLLEVL